MVRCCRPLLGASKLSALGRLRRRPSLRGALLFLLLRCGQELATGATFAAASTSRPPAVTVHPASPMRSLPQEETTSLVRPGRREDAAPPVPSSGQNLRLGNLTNAKASAADFPKAAESATTSEAARVQKRPPSPRVLLFFPVGSAPRVVRNVEQNVRRARESAGDNCCDVFLAHYDGEKGRQAWRRALGEEWYTSKVRFSAVDPGFKFALLKRYYSSPPRGAGLVLLRVRLGARRRHRPQQDGREEAPPTRRGVGVPGHRPCLHPAGGAHHLHRAGAPEGLRLPVHELCGGDRSAAPRPGPPSSLRGLRALYPREDILGSRQRLVRLPSRSAGSKWGSSSGWW